MTDKKPQDDAGAGSENNQEGKVTAPEKSSEKPAGDNDGKTAWVPPKDIPEHMAGKNADETLEKVLKAYRGAREQLSKSGKDTVVIPEKAEDYNVELPKELAEKVLRPDDSGKDPIFEKIRLKAHEEKIPPAIVAKLAEVFYGEVAEMMSKSNDNGGADTEFKELGGAEKAKPVIDAADAWIAGLKNQNVIDDDDVIELKGMASYGQGLRVLEKIRVLTGGKAIPVNLGGDNKSGNVTEADLKKMQDDPRYWRDKDPEFIKTVTAGYEKIYGKKAS